MHSWTNEESINSHTLYVVCICLIQDLNTPLHLAVMSKHLDVVKLLDSSGASSSVENKVHNNTTHVHVRTCMYVHMHIQCIHSKCVRT